VRDRVSTRPRVLALVLTFDAPEHLLACLRGILDQSVEPDAVLVIDNASRIPAKDVAVQAGLSTEHIEFFRLPENVGPAGGYAAGLRRFAASDYDAAWVIDDDCVPDRDCLSCLLENLSASEGLALIFPTVLDPQGVVSNYPAWHGVLIPRIIVESVGVPKEDLFWWAEDSEYLQWRIPKAGYAVLRVPEARLTHYVWRPRKRAAWKYYYETRNFIYYLVHVQGRREPTALFMPLFRTFIRVLTIEDRRLLKLQFFARGFRDGLAGRLGRQVPAPRRDEATFPLAD
jgi:rhamnopyranosyl-N-acetylglucosaminyl-diphospho-decaprenol beta-1,3/1,4-galactofuranosyltransferase